MLEALVRSLPRDLLRVIYALYLEVYLQENLQVCRRLFLEFRTLEGQFQSKLMTYDEDLSVRLRALMDSRNTQDGITYLNSIFRSIGGHREHAFRQLVSQYKQYARAMQYYVNDVAYDICEQIWMSLYVLNRTPSGRRSLVLEQVERSRVILTKEVHLVYLGIQILPRYQYSKVRILQHVVRRLIRYLQSWSFYIRRWMCRVPVAWLNLERLVDENPEALRRFLEFELQIIQI